MQYWHNQTFSPVTSLSGDLYFSTATDPFRRTNTDLNNNPEISQVGDAGDYFEDITRQFVTSNVQFSSMVSPFGIDLPFSLGYSRALNIVTDEVDPEEYTAQINPRPWTPFANSGPEILNSLSLQLRPAYKRQFIRKDTVAGGGFADVRTAQGVNLSPSVSLNPRFGYFTISPRFQTNSSLFFRKIHKQANASGGIDTTFIDGLQAPFWYSYGVDVSTTLYGVVQPGVFGINAIRHRVTPSIGISINPDFSEASYGYYDEFFNPNTNRVEKYSVFEADRATAGIPGSFERRSITYGLDNSFEAKIDQGDTLEDLKVTLLNLNINGSYNLADSLKPIEPFTVSANSSLARIGTFSANATMTPYRADTTDPVTDITALDQKGVGIDFPWVRVTQASATFSTTFSDEGFRTEQFATEQYDTNEVARRHSFDGRDNSFDGDRFFGRRVRGDSSFRVPWRASFQGTYSIIPTEDSIISNFYVSTTFSFSLTPTTEIVGSGSYDLNAGRFNIPTISLTKDLHDWLLKVTYRPVGFSEGFTVSIGFKPSLLRDLEQEFRF